MYFWSYFVIHQYMLITLQGQLKTIILRSILLICSYYNAFTYQKYKYLNSEDNCSILLIISITFPKITRYISVFSSYQTRIKNTWLIQETLQYSTRYSKQLNKPRHNYIFISVVWRTKTEVLTLECHYTVYEDF